MKNLFNRFVECESGATAIEYALLAALISVGIIGAAGTVGTEISSTFADIETSLQSAPTP